MSELPTQSMVHESASPDSASENTSSPELLQAQIAVQTIQRFQMLQKEILDIPNAQEQADARAKLDALARNEYGRAWEMLKQPGVEVIPIVIGGKTKDELSQEILASGYEIYSAAKHMVDSPKFLTLSQPEPVVLARFTVDKLGFLYQVSTDEIFTKAQELGLELCPAEVGLWYILQMPYQPMREYVHVAMQPIEDDEDFPSVFRLAITVSGRSLYDSFAAPHIKWTSDKQLLFRLPLLRPEPSEATSE